MVLPATETNDLVGCNACEPPIQVSGWGGPPFPTTLSKGNMEPKKEFQGSPPSPNSIYKGVGMLVE